MKITVTFIRDIFYQLLIDSLIVKIQVPQENYENAVLTCDIRYQIKNEKNIFQKSV